ncbi:neurotoxin 3FTx-LI-like [Megalops cyprinoides]|uniref:neurotoxin 3FTx-LI-like n=1 Tax=Megalops cyprinoides TaxID=118141 RepID=UPI0018650BA7|nr:neurotoxin 3FTx-LI-like [Megalops cyprinoides]
MNKIIFGIAAVTVAFVVGQALECYQCEPGSSGMCNTTKITCQSGELCFREVVASEHGTHNDKKGCMKREDCPKEGISNKTTYAKNYTCCATDLCNMAPSLPHLAPLSLTLATLTSTLAAFALL